MSFCPKCGNTVDETMTFCPRCGASLKMETTGQTSPASTPSNRPPVRNEKQEKNEKGEKNEKHEKGGAGGSHIGWFIAGIVILLIGVFSYVNATWGIFNGAASGAITVIVIGLLIVAAGVYFSSKAKSRNPAPT